MFSTIRVDLSKIVEDLVMKKASDQVYHQLDFDIVVFFGFTETQAQRRWKTGVSR